VGCNAGAIAQDASEIQGIGPADFDEKLIYRCFGTLSILMSLSTISNLTHPERVPMKLFPQ
jgi:hypothetical protein